MLINQSVGNKRSINVMSCC